MADAQTRGRGRERREWASPEGGLWFSVVFKPRKIKDPFFYGKLMAVSTAQTLRRIGADVNLKWPNDFFFKGKKLGGMLVEGVFEGAMPLVIVVGIGLNVNNELPDHLKGFAISLKDILKKEIPPKELLRLILKRARSNRRKYSCCPHILTRIWKEMLDLKEGQNVECCGRSWKIERILPDRIILERDGERREIKSARELYG